MKLTTSISILAQHAWAVITRRVSPALLTKLSQQGHDSYHRVVDTAVERLTGLEDLVSDEADRLHTNVQIQLHLALDKLEELVESRLLDYDGNKAAIKAIDGLKGLLQTTDSVSHG